MKKYLVDGKSIARGCWSYVKENPVSAAIAFLAAGLALGGMAKGILAESEVKDGPIEVDGKVE